MTLATNKVTDDPIAYTEWNEVATVANKVTDGTLVASDISDFDTEVSNNTTVTGKLTDVVDDTTPQLGGNVDWNGKASFVSGQTVAGSDDDLVYLSSADTWSVADASVDTTCSKQLGIRLSASTVLTLGIWTTTGLTAGSIYYASEASGAITTTAPTTSTSIVRVIGTALSTTELFVNPDITWVELA